MSDGRTFASPGRRLATHSSHPSPNKQVLDATAKGSHALSIASLRATGALLVARPHFNHSAQLMSRVTKQLASRDKHRRDTASAVFTQLFATDKQGETTIDAVRLIAECVRGHSCDLPDDTPLRLLSNLTGLRPQDVAVGPAKARRRSKDGRGKRRTAEDHEAEGDGSAAAVAQALADAQTGIDVRLRSECHAAAVHEVTLVYFYVLKHASASCYDTSDDADGYWMLLPAALDGLARHGHMINIDTAQDVLSVLEQILISQTDLDAGSEDASPKLQRLTARACLECIRSSFALLEGPGRELVGDDRHFVNAFYRLVARTAAAAHAPIGTVATADAAAERCSYVSLLACAHSVLLKRRERSNRRVAAFVHGFLALALVAPANFAAPLVATARACLGRYPSTQCLVDYDDEEADASSAPLACDDPEVSDALYAPLWQLSLLRRHASNAVAEQASGALASRPLKPADQPGTLLAAMLDVAGNDGADAQEPPARRIRPPKDGKYDRHCFPRPGAVGLPALAAVGEVAALREGVRFVPVEFEGEEEL